MSSSPTSKDDPHGNCRVLITRPAHQSAEFTSLLMQEGLTVVSLPSIEIEFKLAELTEAQQSDLVIFTSVNAVTGAHQSLPLPWHSSSKIAAIGSATAQALHYYGCSVDVVPTSGSSTEALLEVIGEVDDRNITIIRGNSGREALYNTLAKRGAKVHYQCVYDRKTPHYTEPAVRALFSDGLPDITSVTSDLGLTNLLSIIPPDIKLSLLNTSLVVNSQRCAALARQAGFSAEVLVADPPGNKAQLAQILRLRRLTRAGQ